MCDQNFINWIFYCSQMPSEKPQKDDFKTVRDRAEVLHHLRNYIGNRQDIKVHVHVCAI